MNRILFFGSSAFGLPALQALRQRPEIEIVAVVTQPAKPQGRKQILTPTSIGAWAQAAGLPILTPATLKDEAMVEQLRAPSADTFLTAAYGLIFPSTIIDLPPNGCLNIHASLLPKYRGANPIAAAILSGDQETGITYMKMDRGVDTGPILAQHRLPISDDETAADLSGRLAALAARTITDALDGWWKKRYRAVPQPETGVSYAPKLTRDSGRAAWDSGRQLAREVRAYQPWPGVWTEWQNQTIKILESTFQAAPHETDPGTVVSDDSPIGWSIATADGWFRPTVVQISGKKPQPAATFSHNYPGWIGTRLAVHSA